MANATAGKPRAGIRGTTTTSKEVLLPPKRTVINWTTEEREAVVSAAIPLFSRMVSEGHWEAGKGDEWARHLAAAAQDLALPEARRRPLKGVPIANFGWFINRVEEAHRRALAEVANLRQAQEQAVRAAEAKAAKQEGSRELDEGVPRRRKRKVYWTKEEMQRLIERGWEIREADPRRGDLPTLRKAQEDVLPPERHRALESVSREMFAWFFEGVEAHRPPEPEPQAEAEAEAEPEPEPEPQAVEVVVTPAPAPGEEATWPQAFGVLGPMVALNKAVLQAASEMMRDIHLATQAMARFASESGETRKILAKLVEHLDPKILEEVRAEALAPPTPVPAPAPVPAPPPEPAPPRMIEHHLKPKVAIVAPHMTQARKIRETLEPCAEVRIYETGREARNKRFSNAQYIVFSTMVGHDVIRLAESILPKDRVILLNKNGAEVIIERVMQISHKHVEMMESKERMEREAKDKLRSRYNPEAANNGQNGVY